jgi:cytochrome c556
MIRRSMHRSIAALMLAQLAIAGAAASADAPSAPPQPKLTIQQLMDTRVDPSADALWDSVAFIASAKGEEDRRPRTPAQWDAVRRSALALLQAVDELSVPGRRVASGDKKPGRGELKVSAIQRLIDSDPDAFARHARGLRSAATKALNAIDARDADALMNAGGLIDEACEACHVTYWYPDQTQATR